MLPFEALVEALAVALRELAAGRIACPLRQVVSLPRGGLLSMSAVADDVVVHKLVTVVPDNPRRDLPTIQGRLTVIDPSTGRVTMTLDAATVTGRRTAAVTMLGIATLSREAPRDLLLIGTGVQASHHVEAIAAMFPETTVFVLGRDAGSARRFVERTPDAARLVAIERLTDAPRADVVITCTSSRVPVYREPASVERLIVAVGSYEPDVAEIGADTVRASRVIADDPSGAVHEAGDLILAGIDPNRVEPLAELLDASSRRNDRPLLLKTVGCAAWDLAAARVALMNSA